MKKKRLAIIPARGGSKRIPRKNIKPFLGKPIILHVLDEISKEGLFDEIHVSTEDDEILDLVTKAGYPPAFRRDPLLSDDYTPLGEVLCSVVERYRVEKQTFDTIVLIYATAALMEEKSLSAAVRKFEMLKVPAEMISVAPYPVPIEWAMRMDTSGKLTAVQQNKLSVRSQDLEESWYETAEFVIYGKRSLLDGYKGALKMGFPVPYFTIDIDTLEHWRMAELIAEMKNEKI
ncbi:MAG TPA: pseudaminic acid cytidylyltransferase [Gammaproteobacteria bacterium]|jgi:N-acylneuraminate cytidylyltransferase|nr:pseudaminic acid cytidylyltransferase [Candidatus Neomarinimicrobiota bacterium]MBT6218056.1 pseudaminic acid cytidylyltransferase [Candidatus Neomarinimicrobiota bacterium]MBT6878215.1 pseudaminic acid cytidylyltransferase [Gammaproteobacteria bacterium]MBT7480268.1 pseudaminic acid cytidylyltransferase [Gammaproteobacteria bacterium]HIJ23509.1 pseudaminic acid cytidylyltransferase [Gammaproteobacteria bacterium]